MRRTLSKIFNHYKGLLCVQHQAFKTIKSTETPCLMAVVFISGMICEIEQWRTKMVEEKTE